MVTGSILWFREFRITLVRFRRQCAWRAEIELPKRRDVPILKNERWLRPENEGLNLALADRHALAQNGTLIAEFIVYFCLQLVSKASAEESYVRFAAG
jgi:hypothetical protein